MIHATLPRPTRVRLTGGTSEERDLHGPALAQHFGCEVAFYAAGYAEADMTFSQAMSLMCAAQAPLAEEAVRWMDSTMDWAG